MPEQHGQHRTGMQNFTEGGAYSSMGNPHHSHSNQSGDLDVAHVSKPIAKAVASIHAFHASIIPLYLTQSSTPSSHLHRYNPVKHTTARQAA